MTKRSTTIVLLVLTGVAAAFSQTWHSGALEDALAVAKKEKKLLLVNFYSPSG